MALSCVYRTGQRFGVNYVVDVLLGKEHDRIKQFGHDSISTYGIGKEHSENEWRSLLRQLLSLGYIYSDVEGYLVSVVSCSSHDLAARSA